jgi:hypothetical protein
LEEPSLHIKRALSFSGKLVVARTTYGCVSLACFNCASVLKASNARNGGTVKVLLEFAH